MRLYVMNHAVVSELQVDYEEPTLEDLAFPSITRLCTPEKLSDELTAEKAEVEEVLELKDGFTRGEFSWEERSSSLLFTHFVCFAEGKEVAMITVREVEG